MTRGPKAPKKGVLRILSSLKSIALGRVWTHELWVQWQARYNHLTTADNVLKWLRIYLIEDLAYFGNLNCGLLDCGTL
jgi:hypothetical protein